MKAIRNALQSATVRLASETGEVKRTEEVAAKSARVQKALDAYCAKLAEFNASSRFLFAELTDFYPECGPLTPALNLLGEPEGSSPWSDASATTRSEAMKLNISMPSAGIGKIALAISEDIKSRDTLAQEVQHYTEKVGRLQQEFNNAKPKDRDEAKLKLEENKEKLARAMQTHGEKRQKVEASLTSLDADMVAVLTPTLLQLLKAQMSWYTDCVNYYNTSLEGVQLNQKQASRGSLTGVNGAGTSAASVQSFAPVSVAAAVDKRSEAAGKPCVVKALADFQPMTEGDLQLKTGDIVLVLKKNDDGWWEARGGEEFGSVPMNYLEETEAVPLGKAEAKFDFATEDTSEAPLKQGQAVDVLFPSVAALDTVSWVLVKTSSTTGYVPRSYLQVKAAVQAAFTAPAKAVSLLAVEAAKAKPSPTPQTSAPLAVSGASKTAAPSVTETTSSKAGTVPSSATFESKPTVTADAKPSASAKVISSVVTPASTEPKPTAPAVATRKASLDASSSFVAPPATSPFWTQESTAAYAKLLKMGMPIEQVVMKMEREGADTGLLKGGSPVPATSRDALPQPAASSQAPASAPAVAPPAPAVAAPQAKSFFKRSSPAPTAAPAAAPAPAPAPKKVAAPAPAAGVSDAPPAAKPSALLSGIQGFNKTKLKHADTVEKVSLPAPASKTSSAKASPAASAPAPAGRAPQGLSLMDEMRARAARRA